MTARELHDELLLRRLVEAYAVAVDTRDAELFRSLWTEDATLSVHRGGEETGRYDGPAQLASVIDVLGGRYETTVHVIGAHQVRLGPGDAADRATGIVTGFAHQLARQLGGVTIDHQLGLRYVDRYVRAGDDWRFAARQCHQLWLGRAGVWP